MLYQECQELLSELSSIPARDQDIDSTIKKRKWLVGRYPAEKIGTGLEKQGRVCRRHFSIMCIISWICNENKKAAQLISLTVLHSLFRGRGVEATSSSIDAFWSQWVINIMEYKKQNVPNYGTLITWCTSRSISLDYRNVQMFQWSDTQSSICYTILRNHNGGIWYCD